ncbi:MAG TPA: hypothetical protein VFE47_20210 [Tepidisphaeraceae bacterium]|jgi:hypothetical protein|nr:hypothetical protein [Tepidisphaeraceae bacterium]
MTSRRIFLAALALSLASISSAFAADAVPMDIIARFDGVSQGSVSGKPVTLIGVTVLSNGKTARVPLPNMEVKKGEKPMPKKELDDAVRKLAVGQIIRFSVEPNKELGTVLASVDVYDLKPGEDTPKGYVFSQTFDKTVGKTTTTTVVLTKFGVEHTFTVAMRRGENGQEQDPDVVAAITKLTPGTGVWVQTQGKSVITAIEPYTEPKTGKMGKISETEVDGHKVKSAEIDQDGKTITVMVPGREVGKAFVQDPIVAGQLGRVRPGAEVQFRVHEDGDKMWLREIETVKPGPKKPAEKPPAK